MNRNFSEEFEKTFISNITPSGDDKEFIRDVVIKIKAVLREGLSKEYGHTPRFMTQGSAGYKTQNLPCWKEFQQMDHDIGCYLPFSEFEDDKPKTAAKDFFAVVDGILDNLARQEKWEICKAKETCCRVIIRDDIHIDIPLYSIPDEEYKTITESVEARKSYFAEDSAPKEEEESWDYVKFNRVILATRSGGWKESDPRKINMYFRDAFEMKGEQLRRLCRYVKAWRDYKWKRGGPTSIYLMCLIDDLYDCYQGQHDDLILLDLLGKIPERLKKPVKNKSEDEELKMKEPKDLELLSEYAKKFARDLGTAISNLMIDDEDACKLIQNHLGNRFPICSTIKRERERISEFVEKESVTMSNAQPLARTRVG